MNPNARVHNRRQFEAALALLLLTVVSLIVLPIPLFLLDTLIAVNITLSIVLLMIPLYSSSQAALSTFPALLLFSTLFRLSLNIASTKQIMLHADAGHIIDTFGKLVVGGNVVVGLIVFLIIATVQFIVIAKGGERVAEVGARFALDAMPGKQMSIDADLRAGNITNDEAQRRRDELDRESKLHGAMDGAMKFVKGDAIASVIIALVNIVGGICVGVFMKNMTLSESMLRYTVLTVGDGMVSQIPSLFVSVAAGVVITRVTSKANRGLSLGTEIGKQLSATPQALGIAAGAVGLFVLVPGFPKLQFLAIAALLGFAAYSLSRKPPAEPFEQEAINAAAADADPPLPLDEGPGRTAVPLRLRYAADLREHLEPGPFERAIAVERRATQQQTGIPFPRLRVVQDEHLAPGTYAIDVQELPAESGSWREMPQAAQGGDPLAQALAARLGQAVRDHAGDFIGLQEAQTLMNTLERDLPDLVSEVNRTVPIVRVAETLRHLAREGVSLRHMRETLESLLHWGPKEREPFTVVEMVRVDIGKFVVHPHLDEKGELHVHMVAPEFEAAIRSGVQQGGTLTLALDVTRQIQQAARFAHARLEAGQRLVLLCPQDVRRHVVSIVNHDNVRAVGIAFQEVPPGVPVKVLGTLRPGAAEMREAA